MIQITPQHQIFICTKPIDFRKGLDGMAAVCKQVLQADPFCGAIFAFTNRSTQVGKLQIEKPLFYIGFRSDKNGFGGTTDFLFLKRKFENILGKLIFCDNSV